MSAGLPQHLTLDYLRSLLSRGVEHAPVTEEARKVLRQWVIEARRLARGDISAPPAPVSGMEHPHPEGVPESSEPASVDEISFGNELRAILNGVHSGGTEEEPAVPRHVAFDLEGETEEEKLASLRELVLHWPPLKNLNSLRETPVFSSGNPRADIMMVTDAPGLYEEKLGRPLAGPSGEKLDAMLQAMGLSRSDIYLTHLVKFRPSLPRQLTNNRPPPAREIEISRPILREEIMLVRPKVVVALGAIAARGILQSGETPLSALRGTFHTAFDTPVRVTYNPSYLLRTEDISEKRKVWEDMLCVMERAGLPISDKQRSYFLPRK
ncbi:uracil-DNA glycosylase [Akkermansia sp. BIOML-A48]|uniref:uracil-DNA glycosylase n=1 Tax=Akkermansia sp. BIOML-A48 TaxID=2584604 RepID=UPI00122F6EED|nr:uracil-DNA glycosylase [Akkermansia sp. BIOML-A48]KAA3196178.1 uracil-DNA glycosylase [Akkermansia sp. BIOML-A48]